MAIWPNIDSTSPADADKVKFGAGAIRSLKSNIITSLQKVCNYQDNGGTVFALRTAVWATAGRPTGTDLVDKATGYNTDLGYDEYYDLASTTWKPKALPVLSSWAISGRPSSPYTGQYGYNSDLCVTERWNGSAWIRVEGGIAGEVKPYAMTTAPAGWLKCNGAAISRTTYADLFLAIGTVYGVGDGSTTFNLPDLRGEFIRGFDDGRGVDSGRVFGSSQAMSTQDLFAEVADSGNQYRSNQITTPSWSINRYLGTGLSDGSASGSMAIGTAIGTLGTGETRPRNIALLVCIKF